MDRIKTRLIIAVTNRLSAAEDTNAKADLIEELSENLYQRYLDLIGSGVSEEDAYQQAMDWGAAVLSTVMSPLAVASLTLCTLPDTSRSPLMVSA